MNRYFFIFSMYTYMFHAKIQGMTYILTFFSLLLIMFYYRIIQNPIRVEQILMPDSYTIAINTFDRVRILKKNIIHYLDCPNVKNIVITWNNNNQSPNILQLSSNRIQIITHSTNSLNNRFNLTNNTAQAVFVVDDDIKVSCVDLDKAYTTWKVNNDSLIGFFPRFYFRGTYGGWWSVFLSGKYNIILTKAALLSSEYLKVYTQELEPKIKNYVDREKNCEDLAMQFLIYNMSRKPPIYTKGHLYDYGIVSGLSTKSRHFLTRSECLRYFSLYFNASLGTGETKFSYPSTLYELASF